MLLVDLAQEDGDATALPSEVPGLDEAVASWYELEGIDPPEQEEVEIVEEQISGSLPFGFSGESNTHISRLPFGVGSYSGGMPFDESEDALPLISEVSESPAINEPEGVMVEAPSESSIETPLQPNIIHEAPVVMPSVVESPPPPLTLPPVPEAPTLSSVEPVESNPLPPPPQAFSPEPLRVAPVPISLSLIHI